MLFCGKKEKKNTCSLTPVQMESESRKSKRPKKPLTKRVADGLPVLASDAVRRAQSVAGWLGRLDGYHVRRRWLGLLLLTLLPKL